MPRALITGITGQDGSYPVEMMVDADLAAERAEAPGVPGPPGAPDVLGVPAVRRAPERLGRDGTATP
ncbi:hypothetical protein CcI49_08600 [Frankia sp. CcI49]|uniref:hypothetical protein n=1 Tax=unclassified Frankia TaxID=2632575 RepID=UPI0006CA2A9E|nr:MULTISPECIES: hypothetical protein [unclassified Frankia]KPM54941.1 hypothetical protein ACG83_16330 [Frankia sp. R43]ONH61147.1 hypothetical protein CcI49_08600 [Frankia sp. CcI49]